jgi:hypothetical protein
MALRPVAGLAVIKTIDSVLERFVVTSGTESAVPRNESQDEYGMFDIDVDDPTLNALLDTGVMSESSTTAALLKVCLSFT